MPAALPNRKNNVKLTPAKAAKAQASIQNFFSGPAAFPWPPLSAEQSAQMAAAVAPMLAEINKVQVTAAKQATGSIVPPAPVQLAAQQENIATSIPGIAKFLPAGTDLNNTSFANAISTMQDTVAAIQAWTQNPTSLGAQSSRDASLSQYFKNK